MYLYHQYFLQFHLDLANLQPIYPFQSKENHTDFAETVIIGLQPRGIYLAELIHQKLEASTKYKIPLGYLDTTFHRDDFRRREIPAKASETRVDFVIEGKKVVLIDDVANSGRTMLYALKPLLNTYPKKIQTLALVERTHKSFPVDMDYTGLSVSTNLDEHIYVEEKDGEILGAWIETH